MCISLNGSVLWVSTNLSKAAMASPALPFSFCSASAIPLPSLFGANILSLHATPITNFSSTAPSAGDIPAFCNITLTYTHPGENDMINIEAWLPFQKYNDCFQAAGGDGWCAGRSPSTYQEMETAIMQGYATATTDAGLGYSSQSIGDPWAWALVSPGNVNLYKLQDFASLSLNEEAVLAKVLIESFYGQPPKYSYWNGCSQGGRQGLTLAQRHPDAYDGIMACAPAINWGDCFRLIFGQLFLWSSRANFRIHASSIT